QFSHSSRPISSSLSCSSSTVRHLPSFPTRRSSDLSESYLLLHHELNQSRAIVNKFLHFFVDSRFHHANCLSFGYQPIMPHKIPFHVHRNLKYSAVYQ